MKTLQYIYHSIIVIIILLLSELFIVSDSHFDVRKKFNLSEISCNYGNIIYIYSYIDSTYDTYIYIYVCSIIRDNVAYECFRVLDYL